MNNPDIYICECGRESHMPANTGLPNGWIKRHNWSAESNSLSGIICPVCADFEEIVTAYEEGRTHDSTSAINDEPVVRVAERGRCGGKASRWWLVTLTFITDKGTVETNWPTVAANALDAMLNVKMGDHSKAELARIVVTTAPLEMQNCGFAPSLQNHEKIAA